MNDHHLLANDMTSWCCMNIKGIGEILVFKHHTWTKFAYILTHFSSFLAICTILVVIYQIKRHLENIPTISALIWCVIYTCRSIGLVTIAIRVCPHPSWLFVVSKTARLVLQVNWRKTNSLSWKHWMNDAWCSMHQENI